jgi:ribonuclease Z
MSLEKGFEWSFSNHNFKGYSIAGQTTSLVYNNAKICFDIAQGLPFNLSAKYYCLTHLHADHGAGLNYLLSQRSLFRLPPAIIMLPKPCVESVEIILKEWMKIEGFNYQYELIGVDHNFFFDLDKNYSVRAFSTTHRVDSYGYIVYSKKKVLKKEFSHLNTYQIIKLKEQNIIFQEEILQPIICFTGDTQIEFLTSHPDILKSEILFMECTYLDEKKSTDETRFWGHLHLDEIKENENLFENSHISLIHLSARYSAHEAELLIKDKLGKLSQKVSIFPRPF